MLARNSLVLVFQPLLAGTFCYHHKVQVHILLFNIKALRKQNHNNFIRLRLCVFFNKKYIIYYKIFIQKLQQYPQLNRSFLQTHRLLKKHEVQFCFNTFRIRNKRILKIVGFLFSEPVKNSMKLIPLNVAKNRKKKVFKVKK